MRESNARTGSWLIPAAVIGAGAVYAAAMIQRRSRYIQLTGRTVLITGGSRGLGLALAREFARHGATLAICGRDETTLEAARADLRQITPRVLAFPCDVRVEGQTREMVRRVEQAIGPIDILVNNAGTIAVGPQEAMTAADFQEAMDSNFWSAVHATLAVTPSMQARREGRIVNITSIGGKIPVPHLLPYCASKFAFVGFSSGLRTELSKSGVLVTTVVPGLMKTGSPRNADFKGKYRAEYAWFSISDNLPGISVSAPSRSKDCPCGHLRRGRSDAWTDRQGGGKDSRGGARPIHAVRKSHQLSAAGRWRQRKQSTQGQGQRIDHHPTGVVRPWSRSGEAIQSVGGRCFELTRQEASIRADGF